MRSVFIQPEGQCFLCRLLGTDAWYDYLEEHHIFEGTSNRKKSEKYGLKVKLCTYHHRGNINGSRAAVHSNREYADMLHRIGQAKFEESHTREEFRQEFGKLWL